MHSMTRRRASPGPSGRLQVAMAFSQTSSSGCRGQRESTQGELSESPSCLWSRDTGFTYPSFERLPHWESVAHVSEDPQHDDAGLEICDSGLTGQTSKKLLTARAARRPRVCAHVPLQLLQRLSHVWEILMRRFTR